MAEIEARYRGYCHTCETTIREGEQIVATDDGWAHAACGDAPRPSNDPPLCGRCFIYHAGECA